MQTPVKVFVAKLQTLLTKLVNKDIFQMKPNLNSFLTTMISLRIKNNIESWSYEHCLYTWAPFIIVPLIPTTPILQTEDLMYRAFPHCCDIWWPSPETCSNWSLPVYIKNWVRGLWSTGFVSLHEEQVY